MDSMNSEEDFNSLVQQFYNQKDNFSINPQQGFFMELRATVIALCKYCDNHVLNSDEKRELNYIHVELLFLKRRHNNKKFNNENANEGQEEYSLKALEQCINELMQNNNNPQQKTDKKIPDPEGYELGGYYYE